MADYNDFDINYRLNGNFSNYQRYKKTVDAGSELVSVAELKAQLLIDSGFSDDDLVLSSYSTAARQMAEDFCGISFINSTWIETMDYFPASPEIWLSVGNVREVSSIQYTDTDGNLQTWDSRNYIVDNNGLKTRITPAYNTNFPNTRHTTNGVVITYICGYGPQSTDVPAVIAQAVKLIAANFYQFREDRVQKMPTASEMLLRPYVAKRLV